MASIRPLYRTDIETFRYIPLGSGIQDEDNPVPSAHKLGSDCLEDGDMAIEWGADKSEMQKSVTFRSVTRVSSGKLSRRFAAFHAIDDDTMRKTPATTLSPIQVKVRTSSARIADTVTGVEMRDATAKPIRTLNVSDSELTILSPE